MPTRPPPPGPQDPATTTPERAPGSVRRTTAIDVIPAGDEPGGLRIQATGRDLLTPSTGPAQILTEVGITCHVAPDRSIRGIEASGTAVVGLHRLIGARVGRGFRASLARELAEERDAMSLPHLLLDDLPVAVLVSGYGDLREHGSVPITSDRTGRMVDVCAGWQEGATMMQAIAETGRLPSPQGPPAPSLESGDDRLAWHCLPALPPGALRRRRRLDVIPGDPISVDAMFRDSHVGQADRIETVLHEYALVAQVDADRLCVTDATAMPMVLPWPECPLAVASAERVVGVPARGLRDHVTRHFEGVTTCTHLNDVLRSLADVDALSTHIAPAR